jgi:seryl-tRNA synthetase
MLDIKSIRENPEVLALALQKRGWRTESANYEVQRLVDLDERRRTILVEAQGIQAQANTANTSIGTLFSSGKRAEAEAKKLEAADLKGRRTAKEIEARLAESELNALLAQIPNVPLPDVPSGDETNSVEKLRWGERPNKHQRNHWPEDFKPKEHFELGEALGEMDFETATKLSGARFVVLKRSLARLERALGQFMLDLHTQPAQDDLYGYTEIQPPLLVKHATMFGTAQLPKFADDQFAAYAGPAGAGGFLRTINLAYLDEVNRARSENDQDRLEKLLSPLDDSIIDNPFWLIPTAEVPLTNLVRESILDEAALPLRFTALTPCFRSEAGAAGKDTRGMIRQHQFDKVELVSITTPEQSRDEHERMLSCAEEVLKRLDLHYRVMTLSTGDMGFASQKTYDIEVWLPGQGRYREISSCSVCGDFQARRMQARFRPKEGKGTRLVHTLNGSGVAVGRALVAVMENYQNPDSSITVPDALRPYMRDVTRIERGA